MSSWFGNLQLAYKFTIVFVGLLVLTILAGFIKVLYNRHRMAGFVKQEQLEAGQKEDTVELTQREKDEGDLFGIRAIEAGFYAGVAQSAPPSRAGSVMDLSMASSQTLTNGASSPFIKNSMANNSALSLQMGSTNRDSDTLGDNESRRPSPPAIKLRPSEAELSGRHNHNGAVDMTLNVPPSPGYRGFSGSDDGESDGFTSPRSMSPNGNPSHYAPVPAGALQVSYHDADSNARSQTGSFNTLSPLGSPSNPPETRLPTIPGTALRKESRSPSPQDYSQVRR
ncbi:hypothetical protein P153DRAFT_298129 [Dothidotthia symphoricarpi CBS 119687]|uniref:Uncharacterized protein n=1 Tax=Dothidotthia symphoricarpi CBS 119687 TaxID=1392245 RepID=A0A6A6A6P7_9PLEO|nr:uncharacterized protein P153DRAFT_298129 [Dothidotthia symphoricarpi CBS 119687]KAF2126291.1 hypothetical protein P153DRAFT_298129 [Dothidotthia symphoricarpi CBS 119687]